jgi:hypothetical protein
MGLDLVPAYLGTFVGIAMYCLSHHELEFVDVGAAAPEGGPHVRLDGGCRDGGGGLVRWSFGWRGAGGGRS